MICFFIFQIFENKNIEITKSVYSNAKIPNKFNGFVICQISDLHNTEFGKKQKKLINKIQEQNPNIIIITGDLIDRRKYNLDIALTFINDALKIAPVYFASGNHEAWSNDYNNIKNELVIAGVKVLDDDVATISIDDVSIDIIGLLDPDFLTDNYLQGTDDTKIKEQLNKWSKNNSFQILLSHRPELFDLYVKNNIDLVFSGHAHGGQLRLLIIGGIIAPDQGVFPRYTNGFYTNEKTTMYVSRGLGNSIIPLRIFNRPEIVVVTLHSK